MENHPIEGMMGVTIEKIKQMADSNTIVGEPIDCGSGVVIIPISKISYGFASGGSDLPTKTQKDLFGGGAGAGVTIEPIAFISVSNGETKLLQIDPLHSTADRIISMIPDLIEKINDMTSKKKNEVKKEKSNLVNDSPLEEEKE